MGRNASRVREDRLRRAALAALDHTDTLMGVLVDVLAKVKAGTLSADELDELQQLTAAGASEIQAQRAFVEQL